MENVRVPGNKKRVEVRADGTKRVYTQSSLASRTQQQHKDSCDINRILSKYKLTGSLTHLNRQSGVYADLTSLTDYQNSIDSVMKANNAFAALPAAIRDRFQNDPSQLLSFMEDPKNYDEGVKLGLYEQGLKPSEQKAKNDESNDESAKKAPKAKTKPVESET